MRWLLSIPVLLLFFSNVPVTMEMKMDVVQVKEPQSSGCCKKDESVKGTCHKPVKKTCHADAAPAQQSCNKEAAASCVCTCLFQYTAPAQAFSPYKFSRLAIQPVKTGYLSIKYMAPFPPAPWQPPDFS